MANDRKEAEKAYRFAEERFLAGALWSARKARRLFPSLPALQNALAAYEVHAAAARGGRNWLYAVLGLPTGAATHENIKKQYRRQCLVAEEGPLREPTTAAGRRSGFTPPPEPDVSTYGFKVWRAAYARARGTIYCGHCDSESAAAEGAGHGKSGKRCHSCGVRFSPPPRRRRAAPGTGAEPPPPQPPPGKGRQRNP